MWRGAVGRATAEADAFHLALLLLDGHLQPDTRRDASLELEELLGSEGVLDHLEKVFLAHPLPRDADLQGAFFHKAGSAVEVDRFLRTLSALQMTISEICWAWKEIPAEVFGGEGERIAAQAAAVRGGLFRDLVRSRAKSGDSQRFWMDAMLHPPIPELRNQRAVLAELDVGVP